MTPAGETIKLPLAMPVTIRIKTTAVRCIVIRKRHLSLLQNRAQKTPKYLCVRVRRPKRVRVF